jgi:hypothetical protein
MQGFKSYTTHLYLAAVRASQCPDIGTCLWQSSYYDDLITTRRELRTCAPMSVTTRPAGITTASAP